MKESLQSQLTNRGESDILPSMDDLWLIKIGEMTLKKGNRAYFERLLKENIRKGISQAPSCRDGAAGGQVTIRSGRYYLETPLPDDEVITVLSKTPGIVSFSKALRVDKELPALLEASKDIARTCLNEQIGHRFKFEIRRTDKSLPLDSYGYARELGGMLLETMPELVVDVRNPDFTIRVELREKAYIYQHQRPGTGGLPVGSAGRGVLMLSGGIDSPVAGFLMSKRGLRLTAIHFHTPPFTSPEAHDKVVRLASQLAPFCGGLTLYSIPFTDCQVKINKSVPRASTTLHSRACMMQISELLAERRRCGALVTGESLGQVASQTMESLAYTDGSVDLPVFRPLIGMDKEEIIKLCRKIGSYDTAVEPFEDCCTLFSPDKPLTRPDVALERGVYQGIEDLEFLMEEALKSAERIDFDSHGRRKVKSG